MKVLSTPQRLAVLHSLSKVYSYAEPGVTLLTTFRINHRLEQLHCGVARVGSCNVLAATRRVRSVAQSTPRIAYFVARMVPQDNFMNFTDV